MNLKELENAFADSQSVMITVHQKMDRRLRVTAGGGLKFIKLF